MARLISGFEAVLRYRQGVLFRFGVLCVRPLIQSKPICEASSGHNSRGGSRVAAPPAGDQARAMRSARPKKDP